MKKEYKKLLLVAAGLILAFIGIRVTGLHEYISLDNARQLETWVSQYGMMGPVVFIIIYILACIVFLPGLPVTIVGALAFGAVRGAVFSSIGSILGATAAFLIARYAARDMVEKWIEGNRQFEKIDKGVQKNGWRMLMITRMVPLFPFNLQNFAYGLTKIKLRTYILVSWICMLPGVIAYNFMAGSVVSGEGDLRKTFLYLAIGALFFVIISFIPGYLSKKRGEEMEEYKIK
ncbi:TVP38/TMEM64 family protein [Isachenkonia alkalipeptolytica]|uniref:TVP38/TMEM64 family membrane protein n=1 Tax=Isachenkonia alkalipeptolytica TaxID=2565777 RepID=A0AA43XK82_9CLOT|nr:TVP38/TMEM64 family protein [Isachenkonia alkalipeptolytica]NBG87831.1 TVP38/TMEM64 family protein [Isachenkonia alkalipeptolytica]